MMIHVMIVEDEPLVRIGLKSIVNWEQLGMRVGCDAANGADALDAWRARRFDIVITDIRMPRMDGLVLMREIRATDARTRFIVLTCLDEFSMLKQAMELDITAYILKLTSTREEVEGALNKARRELSGFERTYLPAPWLQQSEVAEQLLRDFLIHRSLGSADFGQCMAQIGVNMAQWRACVGVFLLPEGMALLEMADDPYGYKLHRSVVNILQQRLNDEASGQVMFDQVRHYVVLLRLNDATKASGQAGPDEIMASLADALLQVFNATARWGVSDSAAAIDALPGCYAQAIERLQASTSIPIKLASAMRFMADNYMTPISIQDAADTVGFSAGHLAHLMLRHYGATFNDCLNRLRVDRAKKLLADPDARVSEVAQAVGIPNTTYFTRLFRRYAGSSPRDYRRGLGL